MKKKAIFLDKDGTIIPDIPYNVDPDKITITEETLKGLRSLKKEGFQFIVITNQSGIARGYFEENKLKAVFEKVSNILEKENIAIDKFYYCPHHPDGIIKEFSKECDCRKPLPGLILKAAAELNIDLQNSWMMGDILNDVEAGNRAGCRSILIDNGGETEWKENKYRKPFFTATDINDAAGKILEWNKAKRHEERLAKL